MSMGRRDGIVFGDPCADRDGRVVQVLRRSPNSRLLSAKHCVCFSEVTTGVPHQRALCLFAQASRLSAGTAGRRQGL